MSCEKLKRAFNLVSPPADWRAPIDVVVPEATMLEAKLEPQDIVDAIIHYTATVPRNRRTPNGWEFKATGYRNGPAGP